MTVFTRCIAALHDNEIGVSVMSRAGLSCMQARYAVHIAEHQHDCLVDHGTYCLREC